MHGARAENALTHAHQPCVYNGHRYSREYRPGSWPQRQIREEAFPGIKLVLVAGGGDPRKNVEMVAKVVGEIASGEVPLQLDVLGKYNLAQKSHLRLVFKQAGAEA